MAVNLLSLFTDGIGKDFGPMAAQLLGETPAATSSAMGSIVPTLLTGLMKAGGTNEGASGLLSLLGSSKVNAGLLDNVAGLFSGGNQSNVMSAGASLLGGLFGESRLGGIASAVASLAGIRSGSATSLLSLAAPLVMGALQKYISGNKLDAGGLQSLLAGQSQFLSGKLNDSVLGAAGLGSAATFLSGLGGAATKMATGAAGTATAAASTAVAAGSSGLGKLLPWLIGAGVLLLLASQMKSCGQAPTAPAAKAPAAPAVVAPAPAPVVAAPAAPAAAPVVAGPELLKVYFDVNSVTLPAGIVDKVKAFADYAKSSPNTKLGISGYNDKTGDAAKNAELSKNRAKAVRDYLTSNGVPEDRIVLKKPDDTVGAAEDKEARRVEVYVVQ
jgi:outer membrane protein OmpA-like peptidoglycan-associated protein